VEEALEKRAPEPSQTAYAVVVDPNTGEILAMAGTPTFNPNHILPAKFMNRPISDLNPAERVELKAEQEVRSSPARSTPLKTPTSQAPP